MHSVANSQAQTRDYFVLLECDIGMFNIYIRGNIDGNLSAVVLWSLYWWNIVSNIGLNTCELPSSCKHLRKPSEFYRWYWCIQCKLDTFKGKMNESVVEVIRFTKKALIKFTFCFSRSCRQIWWVGKSQKAQFCDQVVRASHFSNIFFTFFTFWFTWWPN